MFFSREMWQVLGLSNFFSVDLGYILILVCLSLCMHASVCVPVRRSQINLVNKIKIGLEALDFVGLLTVMCIGSPWISRPLAQKSRLLC